MVKTIIILITKYFSNKKIVELKIDRQPPPNKYMKKLDCSHEWFDFNENGETVCGGCGNHVSLICDDESLLSLSFLISKSDPSISCVFNVFLITYFL